MMRNRWYDHSDYSTLRRSGRSSVFVVGRNDTPSYGMLGLLMGVKVVGRNDIPSYGMLGLLVVFDAAKIIRKLIRIRGRCMATTSAEVRPLASNLLVKLLAGLAEPS
jgi:hypothetical protein